MLTFADPYFRLILMSVFAGTLDGLREDKLLAGVRDRQGFLEMLSARLPDLDRVLAGRIIDVVTATYGFRSRPASDIEPVLPQTQVLIASGDGPSFACPYLERLEAAGAVVKLEKNHYQILREPAVDLTTSCIIGRQELPV